MDKPALTLKCADIGALNEEFDKNLRRARTFLVGVDGVGLNTLVTLTILHPTTGTSLSIDAEVVYVRAEDPGRGVGLQITPFDPSLSAKLRAFIDATDVDSPIDLPGADDLLSEEQGGDEPSENAPPDDEQSGGDDMGGEAAEDNDPVAKTLQERIRRLSLPEQLKMAKGGTLPERIALERTFGPSVWEALLTNTRLTQQEVARIAKKGTVPKPLLEVIAANAGWLASGEVQRALMSNPRVSSSAVTKILRALTRKDLQTVIQQTAYPATVRQIARKLLKGEP